MYLYVCVCGIYTLARQDAIDARIKNLRSRITSHTTHTHTYVLEGARVELRVKRVVEAREGEVDGGRDRAERDLIGLTDVDEEDVLRE
jgi:hypothetical protein